MKSIDLFISLVNFVLSYILLYSTCLLLSLQVLVGV